MLVSMKTCLYCVRGTPHPNCRRLRICSQSRRWGSEERHWQVSLTSRTLPLPRSRKDSCMGTGIFAISSLDDLVWYLHFTPRWTSIELYAFEVVRL